MLEQQAQQDRLNQEVQNFRQAVACDEQAYTTQAPDLGDAIQYAKGVKFREYTALGLDNDTAALRVQQDAFALAQHAFQNGYSPSELAYRMATALGYRKTAPAPAAVSAAASSEPTEPAPVPGSAEAAVEMRAAGGLRQKGSGGAPSNAGTISMQELARLDNDEFIKMTAGKKWERLFK